MYTDPQCISSKSYLYQYIKSVKILTKEVTCIHSFTPTHNNTRYCSSPWNM